MKSIKKCAVLALIFISLGTAMPAQAAWWNPIDWIKNTMSAATQKIGDFFLGDPEAELDISSSISGGAYDIEGGKPDTSTYRTSKAHGNIFSRIFAWFGWKKKPESRIDKIFDGYGGESFIPGDKTEEKDLKIVITKSKDGKGKEPIDEEDSSLGTNTKEEKEDYTFDELEERKNQAPDKGKEAVDDGEETEEEKKRNLQKATALLTTALTSVQKSEKIARATHNNLKQLGVQSDETQGKESAESDDDGDKEEAKNCTDLELATQLLEQVKQSFGALESVAQKQKDQLKKILQPTSTGNWFKEAVEETRKAENSTDWAKLVQAKLKTRRERAILPIKEAIERDDPKLLAECDQEKIKSYKDKYGEGFLHLAVKNKKYNAITWLVEHGANVMLQAQEGATPIDLAVQVDDLRALRALVPLNDKDTGRDLLDIILRACIESECEAIECIQWVAGSASLKQQHLKDVLNMNLFEIAQVLSNCGLQVEWSNFNDRRKTELLNRALQDNECATVLLNCMNYEFNDVLIDGIINKIARAINISGDARTQLNDQLPTLAKLDIEDEELFKRVEYELVDSKKGMTLEIWGDTEEYAGRSWFEITRWREPKRYLHPIKKYKAPTKEVSDEIESLGSSELASWMKSVSINPDRLSTEKSKKFEQSLSDQLIDIYDRDEDQRAMRREVFIKKFLIDAVQSNDPAIMFYAISQFKKGGQFAKLGFSIDDLRCASYRVLDTYVFPETESTESCKKYFEMYKPGYALDPVVMALLWKAARPSEKHTRNQWEVFKEKAKKFLNEEDIKESAVFVDLARRYGNREIILHKGFNGYNTCRINNVDVLDSTEILRDVKWHSPVLERSVALMLSGQEGSSNWNSSSDSDKENSNLLALE